MALGANIFDAASLRRSSLPIAVVPSLYPGAPTSARLIPGAGNLLSAVAREKSQSVMRDRSLASPVPPFSSVLAGRSVRLLPQFLKQFHPAMLGVALLDVSMISLIFVLESSLMVSAGLFTASRVGAPGFFVAIFLLFATQEGLYSNCRRALGVEGGVAAKAILWTTLLAGLALRGSSSRTDFLPTILLGVSSACALYATRWIGRTILKVGCKDDPRNVLIVGSRTVGQQTADAVHRDPRSRRSVKGFLEEDDFRGIEPSRLRTIAREECIDEVIIATRDRGVAQSAIREARRNQLDVRVVPELFGSEPLALDLEILAGVPLVKIHEHPLPEWTLACKRIADVLVAAVGLVALSPLLLLIAAVVKLDSCGPILYRAARIGRKKQRFTCYKFRTMVPHAEAAKESLRACNEREGAFFKIANDPRITRAGWFLRRYSLDELPQLWNVLRGEMSLVGPRPHPPDDVERYRLEHLQRLDFVPGITGLWQVTARRDRSFERSVSLDVEYIQRWSLALDLRILWQTIPAVFQGSGS